MPVSWVGQVLPLKGKDGKEVKGEVKGESKQQQQLSYNAALLAGPPHTLEFKENLSFVDFGANEEFEADCFRLVYESFLTPRSVYDFYFASKQLVLRKEKGATNTFCFCADLSPAGGGICDCRGAQLQPQFVCPGTRLRRGQGWCALELIVWRSLMSSVCRHARSAVSGLPQGQEA